MNAQSDKKAPLFHLGRVLATPNYLHQWRAGHAGDEEAAQKGTLDLVWRHVTGDFSDCGEEDAQSNRNAITNGARVFNVFHTKIGTVWIITEADRSATTILMPEDY